MEIIKGNVTYPPTVALFASDDPFGLPRPL